jgi:hypothetical protein
VVFFASLFFYFLLVYLPKRKEYLNEQSKKTCTMPLSLFDIGLIFMTAASSILILISIAYQSDQRRGFAFFWLILISLSAYFIVEIWKELNKHWRYAVVSVMLILVSFQMIKITQTYISFFREDMNRKEIIYRAIEEDVPEIYLPAIQMQDSRIIETREILPDLGSRFAKYYGFENVYILE